MLAHPPRAVAAPAGFSGGPTWRLDSFLPTARALHRSYYALHDWIGLATTPSGRDRLPFARGGVAERVTGGGLPATCYRHLKKSPWKPSTSSTVDGGGRRPS